MMRGKIRNRNIAKQLKDFSGLRFGKITPTDVDGLLEFNDKLYIIIEVKYGDASMPYGQQLAFQRGCDAWQSEKRNAYIIVAHHRTPEEQDIDVASQVVGSIYHKKQWDRPRIGMTVRQAIEEIRALHGVA